MVCVLDKQKLENYFAEICQFFISVETSMPQAKSQHGGVRCSHSAHFTQPCCDV